MTSSRSAAQSKLEAADGDEFAGAGVSSAGTMARDSIRTSTAAVMASALSARHSTSLKALARHMLKP